MNIPILEKTNPSVATEFMLRFQKAESYLWDEIIRGLLKIFIEQGPLEFILIGQDQTEAFNFPQVSTSLSYYLKGSFNYIIFNYSNLINNYI
jgi:hypothetical protein